MATDWWQITDKKVVALVEEVRDDHHPNLAEANIGILWRSEGSRRQGKLVIGQAATVSAKWRAVLARESDSDEALDFIIWFAYDWWQENDTRQHRALVDHELCHCVLDADRKASMRGHDIEEFNEIIVRHGLWRYDLHQTAKAIQPHLPLNGAYQGTNKRGQVKAINLAGAAVDSG